jgi:RHS repeat-associated protein
MNAENQLTRVTKNGTESATFNYDPVGRRVEKVAGGVTTTWAYDGEDILRETRGAATTTYIHGPGIDEPLAKMDQANVVSYFHADGLGSITKMTDSAGAVVHTRQYDAWGNLEQGADLPGYAFTGREWDPETGLYYYRARYYDSKVGRFISEDPIGFLGGNNFYGYVTNNPINIIDPRGLMGPGGWIAAGVAAVVGIGELICVKRVQRELTLWGNPFKSSVGGFPQMSPSDPSDRLAHCVAECLITQRCLGGRVSAAFAGWMQDPPWASDRDLDDRRAGGQGRRLGSMCPKQNCYDACIKVHVNGGLY